MSRVGTILIGVLVLVLEMGCSPSSHTTAASQPSTGPVELRFYKLAGGADLWYCEPSVNAVGGCQASVTVQNWRNSTCSASAPCISGDNPSWGRGFDEMSWLFFNSHQRSPADNDLTGLPSHSCTYTPGTSNACTMTHNGYERTYYVYVPTNYVAGKSGILIGIAGYDGSGQSLCQGQEGTENGALDTYVESLASPAPLAVCPVQLKTDPTAAYPNGEPVFNSYWSSDAMWTHYAPLAPPNDSDFVRQIIKTIRSDCSINASNVGVISWGTGSFLTEELAMDWPDLISGVSILSGARLNPDPNKTLPAVLNPISVLYIGETNKGNQNIYMCGGTSNPLNMDTEWSRWATAANITNPNTTATFCDGTYGSDGFGAFTALNYKQGVSTSRW